MEGLEGENVLSADFSPMNEDMEGEKQLNTQVKENQSDPGWGNDEVTSCRKPGAMQYLPNFTGPKKIYTEFLI